MGKFIILALLTLVPGYVSAIEWTNNPKIEELFSDAGVRGTFVLYDVVEDKFVGFDQRRAETRFIPASTFKIPNTLIGLSVGAIKDVDEVLPYGGKPQPFSSWEKDMSLRDAIKISNVPIYQELARRITVDRMSHHVTLLGYGNGNIGAEVDKFWLKGPLKITAVEQAIFLAKLAQNELPYPVQIQDQVHEITLLETSQGWSLHGKTGWTSTPDPDVGWWVGWVVKQGRVYSFALNIDILNHSDARKRVQIGKDSLNILGML